MIRIAIVEDQKEDYEILQLYIEKYGNEKKESVKIVHYSNGLNFLDEYDTNVDLVFMDIEMPHIDGIDTAKKLRQKDENVGLIFVTNMIQCAIDGYEVNAIDFMVKPVSYYNFSKKMDKAMAIIKRKNRKKIVLHEEGASVVVNISDILYIEKEKNYVVYHTKKGNYRERMTITEVEQEIDVVEIFKCSSGCLVNLEHIDEVHSDILVVHGERLPLARRQKKNFMIRFAQYYGGTR